MTVPTLKRIPGGFVVKEDAGWQLQVRPMRLFRLVEVPLDAPMRWGRYWCYQSFEAAVLAALAWDVTADSEPVGWAKRGGTRQA